MEREQEREGKDEEEETEGKVFICSAIWNEMHETDADMDSFLSHPESPFNLSKVSWYLLVMTKTFPPEKSYLNLKKNGNLDKD